MTEIGKVDKKYSNRRLKQLFSYIWEDKALFLFGFIALLLTSGAKLIDPLIIEHIIDVSVPAGDVKDMSVYAFFFFILVVTSGFLSYFQTILLAKLGVKIITKIKKQVFDHLLKLPVSFFDKNQVGELISRVESDGERVKQLFSQFSIMIFGSLIFFVGMLVVLMIKNPLVTRFLIIPVIIVMISLYFVVRYLAKFYKKGRELVGDISSILTEYLQGIKIVQIFNQQLKVLKILEEKSKAKQQVDTKASFIEYSTWGVYGFIFETLFIVIIIWLASPRIFEGAMTIGTFVVFVQYASRIIWPLMMLTENINQIQRAMVSMNRVFQLMELKTESELRNGSELPVFEKEIEFKNVWFQYKQDEWVLKDISFKAKKGERIALVGSSGSGKTTTVSLLCAFYNVTKGTILVDGIPLDNLKLDEWRKKIGLVLQDIYLFPGNVRENVRLYNDELNDERVYEAIKFVQADEIINRLPDAMDSEVKEQGQNLSVGEKQLLSFARAVVFSPEIVILDEATSSIDARTEAKIQRAFRQILEGRTAFIVAHRLSSVISADRILLFKDGQLIGQGKHNELLEISQDYRKLVKLQFLHKNEEKRVMNE